jgi:predicted porin
MNKKLIALAIAGATFAPAVLAQSANPVTLYGTLNIDFENVKSAGASGALPNNLARNRVSANSSNFGFRGTEDLGGGLKAFFQLEMGSVAIDVGGGNLAGRNSAVGLQGSAGTVLLGNWDSPYKSSTGAVDAFYGTGIGNNVNVMSGNSTPTVAAGATRNAFDRRISNVFQYWTPTIAGFSGRFAYNANEAKAASNAAIQANPSLTSFSGTYASGPITLSIAHERHQQFANTATAGTRDKGTKFAGAIQLGTTQLGLLAEQLTFNGNIAATGLSKNFTAGNADQAKINAYYFSVIHAIGAGKIRVAYGADRGVKLNGSTSVSADTRAKTFQAGYSYTFSKRTDVYGIYSKIKNETNSRNDYAINGVTGVSNGADPVGFGLGIRHTF